ncbi:MAG: hypothetical protein QXO17_00620 [Nitrososphaerota archaeon]|nr:hypothetical protein [Candidatus Calditenuis fumarioli]
MDIARTYRLKVVEVEGVEPDLELDERSADGLGLSRAFAEASRRYSERKELIRRFGREYPHVFPDPVVVEVGGEAVTALLRSNGLPIRVRYSGRTYLISLEAGCG